MRLGRVGHWLLYRVAIEYRVPDTRLPARAAEARWRLGHGKRPFRSVWIVNPMTVGWAAIFSLGLAFVPQDRALILFWKPSQLAFAVLYVTALLCVVTMARGVNEIHAATEPEITRREQDRIDEACT